MYYVWKRDSGMEDNFFVCGIEQFEGWADVPWMFAKKITRELPLPLRYLTDSKLMPEDYPRTGGTQFLISEKIANILKELNIPDIDYYPSFIERPNGENIHGYHTINILNEIQCIGKKKSEIYIQKYGPIEAIKFNKMVLNHKKIPDEVKLFRLDETVLVIAHEDVVKRCEEENVTGIHFVPVGEYKD